MEKNLTQKSDREKIKIVSVTKTWVGVATPLYKAPPS